jgi:hypothetical protein
VSSSRSLRIKTEDRAGEVTLLDHDYEVVATGVAALETRVPPGMFKLRVRTGEHVREDYVLVEDEHVSVLQAPSAASSHRTLPVVDNTADGAVITLGRARLHSPAPLSSTTHSHEYHMDAAVRIAAGPVIQRGHGASLFVFARRWSPSGSSGDTGHPARGLTLHATDGALVLDFQREAEVDLDGDPFSGARIALDPGFYRLRLAKGGETFEQGLVIRPPWNVEVFLMATQRGTRTEPEELDLSRAAIFLGHTTFQADDNALRLTEVARQGLTTRQQVIESGYLEEMLREKFANPMLGIFAAHLLLLQPDVNKPLLRVVVDNLVGLLGSDHPDVAALVFASSQAPPRAGAFDVPPMLVASWDIACRATTTSPSAMAPSSLAATIAARRWNSFPWLSWNPPTPPEPEVTLESMPVAKGVAWSIADPLRPVRRATSSLDDGEARLLRLLSNEHGVVFDDFPFNDDIDDDANEISIDAIVRSTRLPATVLAASARSLLANATIPETSHRNWHRVERALRTIEGVALTATDKTDESTER